MNQNIQRSTVKEKVGGVKGGGVYFDFCAMRILHQAHFTKGGGGSAVESGRT